MKKYIEQVKEQPPHERRQAAMRFAFAVTGVIFLGWFVTLGVRLANPGTSSPETNSFGTQLASVFSAFNLEGSKPATLEIASTTNY